LISLGDDQKILPAANQRPQIMTPPRQRKLFSSLVSIFGVAALSFLLGAAVMYFDLPSSGFLNKAFIGARAWEERRQLFSRVVEDKPGLVHSETRIPETAFQGYTLCTFASMTKSGTQAVLLNMKGETVHQWTTSFSKVWDKAPHLPDPVRDSLVCFFGCHLYPNGDLVIVFHGLENNSNGYGLAKLDKDSNILWKYSARVHHDVDVGEDGTIYAVKHEVVKDMPKGLEKIPTPCLVDYLVMLSPDGKELKQPISILEALRDSGYSLLLSSLLEGPPRRNATPGVPLDMFHTNCVRVLRQSLAPRFPFLKPGQVLISMRELDALAALDPQSGSMVWAATGPWRRQHDPQFLDNGNLLIFDNRGLPKRSRVLEYDPKTQAFPWSYSGPSKGSFFTSERGMSQRLPNGNTLIVNSEGKEILEVSPTKEVVRSSTFDSFICSARRFSPDQVPFLKGKPSTHP
jgi:hypothetical protein